MYLKFYGLKEKPFSLTPDSHFLFLSRKHKEAMAHIMYGLQERKGFILLSGEIGAGKTTLCRALIKELNQNYKVALIFNPLLSPSGLLRAIVSDLGIRCKSRTRQDLIHALNQYLVEGNDVVIIIDEAQNLSLAALEQIRLLSNLETEKDKLLQLVLVGQPELKDLLLRESLKQLNQRIAVRYHIQPLDREETMFYIFHRLNIAGALAILPLGRMPKGILPKGRIKFQEDALKEIYIYSGGIPRIINILCDYSLTTGYIRESWVIDKDIVDQAIREYKGIESFGLVPA